ncbi:MAG: glycosyltransferase family 4 protein [Solirubrobacterales bacterium]
MRLLVLTPDFPPGRGGIQQLVGRLVANLPDDDVEVVTLRSRHARQVGGAAEGVKLRELPRVPRVGQPFHVVLLNLAGFFKLLWSRPDAVIVGHIVASPATRVARLLRIPSVLILHAQEIPHRPRLTRRAVAGATATVAVSEHARRLAIDAGADAGKIKVINPGVDLPEAGAEIAVDAPPTIVTIARMIDRYKGHDVMVDVVEQLVATRPDLRWIVVGDGPLRAEYSRAVDQRGLSGNVCFAGAVDDAERDRLLAGAHVFAMPSRVPEAGGGEGFGLVYLEAAARGVPVVAGNEGGARDAVVHGVTGLLVDPRDAGAVATAIGGLIDDQAARESFGKAARRHAERSTWAVFAERVRALVAGEEVVARVLAVSHTAAFGGAERSLLTQLQADAREPGIDAVVASPTGELGERASALGLRNVPGPGFEHSFRSSPLKLPFVFAGLVAAGFRLAAIARTERATLVHANSTRAALIAIAARPFGGPPVITHVRDCLPDTRVAWLIANVTRRGSARVVANSSYAAAAYSRVAGGEAPSVIYNAIDQSLIDTLRRQPPPRLGFASRRGPTIAMVGQITPWKGQDIAIRALAAIKQTLPDAKLAIAGSVKFSGDTSLDNFTYERSLDSLARELGVAADVDFMGELGDVGELLARADVVVMPSWEEPFGRAAVEAMAAGRAVVATSVGGPAEFIEHGVNGMLAPPHEVDAWASAIDQLLTDASMRVTIGARAQADALRRFSPGAAETRLAPIYREQAAAR